MASYLKKHLNFQTALSVEVGLLYSVSSVEENRNRFDN